MYRENSCRRSSTLVILERQLLRLLLPHLSLHALVFFQHGTTPDLRQMLKLAPSFELHLWLARCFSKRDVARLLALAPLPCM